MKDDLSKYNNDELTLIYKNQNVEQEVSNQESESYDEYGHYSIYTQEYTEGCFITTAVCQTFGKPDDCAELTAFREFRDNYMKNKKDLCKEVEQYYVIAPKICRAINAKGYEAAKHEYEHIWNKYLSFAYVALNNNKLEKAYDIYKTMVCDLENEYLN